MLFRFDDEIEDAVDGCRLVRRYIRKRIHKSANGPPKLSTAKEANVKNMEAFFCPRFVVDATIVDRKQEAAEPWPYRFLLIMENENVL